ncbi:hypothetical protein QUF90_22195 [Desulfococcaceae bacterium HSG9]|nr:hypothetical protein [Desulfococcaceae bacterium HSG9]
MSNNRYVLIGLVVCLGILVQLSLYFLDQRDTPTKVAVRFTEAYLKLDDSMSQWLYQKDNTKGADSDVTSRYLEYAAREAHERGLSVSIMRSKLHNLKTEIVSLEADKAEIRITGDKKVYVNPVYATVAHIFDLGQTDQFNEVVNVVKENNQWKVSKDILGSFL